MNDLTRKYISLAYGPDNRVFKAFTKGLTELETRTIASELKANGAWDTVPHSVLVAKEEER